MKPQDLVKFIKENRKGVYNSIMTEYYHTISTAPINFAMEIVVNDLREKTGEEISLNYQSFYTAFNKMKTKVKLGVVKASPVVIPAIIPEKNQASKKYNFKDQDEIDAAPKKKPGEF